MRIPTIQGMIKRRLLLNFRADPVVVQRLLPGPFRPKMHRGLAIVGVCLIRLEQVRPAGWPAVLGLASENAAHRFAVEWAAADDGRREGVYIPRRDTGSRLNQFAGGRLFPGEHHAARFVVADANGQIDFAMQSWDDAITVRVKGGPAGALPASSCFSSLLEASAFFEGGSLGYSATRDIHRLDGLRLNTLAWRVQALEVSEVFSSYFADHSRFPAGAIELDHALIMRDIPHEWHQAADMQVEPARA